MTPFLLLSPKLGVGADSEQWIVLTYRAPRWRPVSFVGSTKAVLLQCLREKGADIAPNALDSLPDTFQAWRAARLNVVHSAVGPSEATLTPSGRLTRSCPRKAEASA